MPGGTERDDQPGRAISEIRDAVSGEIVIRYDPPLPPGPGPRAQQRAERSAWIWWRHKGRRAWRQAAHRAQPQQRHPMA